MTSTTTVGAIADDEKTGLTLDELAAFVEDAREHGIAGGTRLHVRVNMRGGIKRIDTKP